MYRRNSGPFTVATDWAVCSSFTPESLDTSTGRARRVAKGDTVAQMKFVEKLFGIAA